MPILFCQAAAIDQRFSEFPVLTKPMEQNELTLALVRAIEGAASKRERVA